jgi:hypothetical protein
MRVDLYRGRGDKRWLAWVNASDTAGDRVQSHGWWFNQPLLHNEIPIKPLNTKAQRSFLVRSVLEKKCILANRERASIIYIQDLSRPHFMWLFIWLPLIYILYNKTVIISVVLSWDLWITLVIYWIWEAVETLTFSQSEIWDPQTDWHLK